MANGRLQATNMSNAPRLAVCLHQVASGGEYTFAVDEHERWTGVTDSSKKWLATTADLCQGFHQLRIAPECRPLTAFTIPGVRTKEGHLQFVCAPFGLSTLPTHFHQVVGDAIGDLHYGMKDSAIGGATTTGENNYSTMTPEQQWKTWDLSSHEGASPRRVASHCIDDTYGSTHDTFAGHIESVRQVFKRLESVGFGARVDKVSDRRTLPQSGSLDSVLIIKYLRIAPSVDTFVTIK